MKLSCVILTMGDRPAELDRAIASALAQRDMDLEVVIVGNGTDVPLAPAEVTVVPVTCSARLTASASGSRCASSLIRIMTRML